MQPTPNTVSRGNTLRTHGSQPLAATPDAPGGLVRCTAAATKLNDCRLVSLSGTAEEKTNDSLPTLVESGDGNHVEAKVAQNQRAAHAPMAAGGCVVGPKNSMNLKGGWRYARPTIDRYLQSHGDLTRLRKLRARMRRQGSIISVGWCS